MSEYVSTQRFSCLQVLEIQQLRNIKQMLLNLSPGVNMLVGANGAGKTTVCEALSILFHGRSFRTSASLAALTQRQTNGFQIRAKLLSDQGTTKVAMQKRLNESWEVSRDNQPEKRLQDITRLLPLMVLSPDFDNLLDVDPAGRRRCIDWVMFHVEQSFAEHARAYAHCLKQRNRLLRIKTKIDDELTTWTNAMIEHGDRISEIRTRILAKIKHYFQVALIGTTFEGCSFIFQPGWSDGTLKNAISRVQFMEFRRKITLVGPHRADLHIVDQRNQLLKPFLSRGEKKRLSVLLSLACIEFVNQEIDQKTILVIDDWRAELDDMSRALILHKLSALGLQSLVTTTEASDSQYLTSTAKMFHVEHGQIQTSESFC